jgi:hypothetical protein
MDPDGDASNEKLPFGKEHTHKRNGCTHMIVDILRELILILDIKMDVELYK